MEHGINRTPAESTKKRIDKKSLSTKAASRPDPGVLLRVERVEHCAVNEVGRPDH